MTVERIPGPSGAAGVPADLAWRDGGGPVGDPMVAMEAPPRDRMAKSWSSPQVWLEFGEEAPMPLRDHFRPPVEDNIRGMSFTACGRR